MSIVEAIILGIVQGLTEFLPISSSGHLLLVPWLADWTSFENNPELERTFDVALHLGTLFALVSYFRVELWRYLRAGLVSVRRRQIANQDQKMAWLLVVATIPGVILGAFADDFIASNLTGPLVVASMLVVFAGVMWWADRQPQTVGESELSWGGALVIGLAQAVALQPGVSRSGVTITAGRLMRFDRKSAARLSFLLATPITIGALAYKGGQLVADGGMPSEYVAPFVAGILASAISGFAAIVWLLRFLQTRSLNVFVIYRLVIAAAIFGVAAVGWR